VICGGCRGFSGGLAALLSAGCRHALSPAVRQQIDTTLFTQPHTTPDAYKDRIVMLGGNILSTRNLTEGMLLEVLQKPLDATDSKCTSQARRRRA
jgi:outer membrane lipoprotein